MRHGAILAALATMVMSNGIARSQPELTWIQQGSRAGTPCQGTFNAITSDLAGGCFVGGAFQFIADFGGTPIAANGTHDIFLARYDDDGSLLWIRQAGGNALSCADDETITGIGTDALGNVYVAGQFAGVADFDSTSVVSAGYEDAFIAKYDPTGSMQWVRRAGGIHEDGATSSDTDPSGDTVATGTYRSTADFGPYVLDGPDPDEGAAFSFVARYDSDGNIEWVEQITAPLIAYSRGVDIDPDGACFVTGVFQDSLTVGNLTVPGEGFSNAFLARIDDAGQAQWAIALGGSLSSGADVASDSDGNCYVAGFFRGSIDFGEGAVYPSGYQDIFIARFGPDGAFEWARFIRGGSGDFHQFVSIDVNAQGDCLVSGGFERNAVLPDTTIVGDGYDAFMASYDPDGELEWFERSGGLRFDTGLAVASAADGTIFTAGAWTDSASFQGETLTAANPTGANLFVARYDEATLTQAPPTRSQSPQLHPGRPNPFNPRTVITYELESPAEVNLSIFDAAGRRVATLVAGRRPEGRSAVTWTGLDESGRAAASGVYYVRLVANEIVRSRKLTLVR